jgi:drug/metabolite transporter (DMT)-like permease
MAKSPDSRPESWPGSWTGPALILLFCLSQALRDVYFGHVFQGVDPFAVILIAFALSTAIFTAIALLRSPRAFGTLRGQWRTVLIVNLTTALAWSSYFSALGRLEPSIVNTLHSGMAPLTVVALAAFGARLAPSGTLSWGEYLANCAVALAMIGLWWIVLSDSSGIASTDAAGDLAGLALLLVSGASITISLLYCKRLHDNGVRSDVVTSVRYIALILVAGLVLLHRGDFGGIASLGEAATLALLATVLIVLPLYAMQVGISRTAPVTGQVLRSLGPVFVFAMQPFDARLGYSTATLVGILAYSAAAVAANLAHGLGRRPTERAEPRAWRFRQIARQAPRLSLRWRHLSW